MPEGPSKQADVTALGTGNNASADVQDPESRLRERRLRLAIAAAGIGVWEYDLEQPQLSWDDWMHRLHGLDARHLKIDLATWRHLVHPDDRFRALRAMLRVTRSDEARLVQLRVLLPSGECRHLRVHAQRIQDRMTEGYCLVGVCDDMTEQQQVSARIEQLALYDELTGLPNRRLLLNRLEHAITLTDRQAGHRALLLLDLDGFKRVNDTLGHAVGDQLLITFSERLREALRQTDTAARLGGDEFVVLCEALSTDSEVATREAAGIASKIARLAAVPYRLTGAQDRLLYCSTSIGITLFANAACNADEVMKQADIAMYAAKQGGRDTWRFFQASMQQAIEFKESRSLALRQALAREELTLHYLPLVNADGQWCGCEALVRWAASERDLRRPDAFLQLAEDSGLIQAIDDWVLRRACEDFASIRPLAGHPDLHLGVNVSVRQLIDTDFAQRVLRTVEATGLQPQQIRLEVSEQSLFTDVERAEAALKRLQQAGIAVVLDDYGTGPSSLIQLQRLAFHAVKIDQTLIKDIERNPSQLVIVRAALSVTRAFSIPVIAEGVENEAQYQLLRAEGCTLFQGYYFATPMPLEILLQGFERSLC
ncbi:MAG: EAL domain-containing protein [Lamprobacter sp.]|uniref:putative bifunctional diguanylate cyclase/phosphodiesterase n=1 Tax=Lamprobacter sp. TaxID=3100796 RepID=UPI002B261CA9|nr:EAL domain-containing protein [Lamprobacter sp.]MEA3639536.1 EAL domain-containing protein [Lamprobacter sp.]